MEEVRVAGGEAIRFDSAVNTRQNLETIYGMRSGCIISRQFMTVMVHLCK